MEFKFSHYNEDITLGDGLTICTSRVEIANKDIGGMSREERIYLILSHHDNDFLTL